MEHGLGPFGRANLHPRRNLLDRQRRFASQPGSAGQLAGVAVPASGLPCRWPPAGAFPPAARTPDAPLRSPAQCRARPASRPRAWRAE